MNLFRSTLVLIFLTLVSVTAYSQPQVARQYSLSAFGGTYSAITGGTAVTGVQGDDIFVNAIPIGFTFQFGGVAYTQVAVSSNGFIAFKNLTTSVPGNTAGALTTIAPAVMPLWDDLSGNAGTAEYLLTGTAPNRVWTMQWAGWKWNYNSTANVLSFQVKLYETTNVIDFVYSQGTATPNNASATIGIVGATGDHQILTNSGTAPGRVFPGFIDTVTVRPATGQTYRWTPLPACSGAISAGTAYLSPNVTAGLICPSTSFSLIDTTMTIANGINYAWQSSPAGANTWTNLTGNSYFIAPSGNSGFTVTITAGISAPTDFRFVDTCVAAATRAASNVVTVGTESYLKCSCQSGATTNADSDIGRFAIGTHFANPAAVPSPLTNNPAATGTYSDFTTTLPPIDLVQGQVTPFTLSQFSRGNWFDCAIRVYCDFTHNSVFTDPGEAVSAAIQGATAATSPSHTGTITLPATALTGLARLRVVLRETSTASSVLPCGTFSWGETEDYLVNILPASPPAPTVTSNSPVCQKGALTITASISAAYQGRTFTLTGPGISTLTSTTGVFTIPAAACGNGGTYTVTVTSNNLTSPPATTSVIVNCVPSIAVSNIVTPSTCVTPDGSFDISGLAASTTYTASYIRNGGTATTASITSNASGLATLSGLTSGNYTQVFVRTSAGCNSDTIAAVVQVPAPNPPPTPTIVVNPTPICRGNTVNLLVSNPVANGTYAWSGPNGFTSTSANVALTNYTPSMDGTYTVTATALGCPSAPASVTLAMTAASAPPIRNNVTYCQFQPAVAMTVTSTPSYFVEWFDTCSGGPGCVNGVRSRNSTPQNPNAPVPNTNVPGIVMWLARQSAQNGCPSRFDSVYVRVLPKPQVPVVNSTIYYCQFEVVGALTASGINLRWFSTPTGGSGTTVAPVPSTLVPGTYHFYTSQTSVDGCESDRSQITVVIKPKPEPPQVTSPVNLCQGDAPYQLNAIGQDLLWYTLPNGGVGVPVAPVISTSYEDSFFYYVTQRVNGCESDRALIGSYVRYKPNGIITASSASVCQDGYDTFYYYGNGRPDAEYVWFAPLSSTFISGQGTPGPIVIYFDTAGTSTVQLIVNNKGCISKLLAAPIRVRPLPVISFVNRQDACEDELVNVALRAIEPNITSYQWDFGPEATIVYGELRTGGPFGVRYPRAGHYTVSAAATKDGCTSEPKVQDIYIHERPDATISFDYRGGRPLDQFCSMDTLRLTVQQVPEGATYTWTPSAYFQGRMDSLNNEVRAVVNSASYVHVTVKNAFGCESMDSIYVPAKPCCGVYFPNAFTPGSQVEQNRLFRPITNGIHRINNFRVMNRWGQVVWESTEERAGWNGTYRGTPQDMGTYYFYINYRCGDKNVEDQGEVILIR